MRKCLRCGQHGLDYELAGPSLYRFLQRLRQQVRGAQDNGSPELRQGRKRPLPCAGCDPGLLQARLTQARRQTGLQHLHRIQQLDT